MKKVISILVLLLATGAIGYTPPADKLPLVSDALAGSPSMLQLVGGGVAAPRRGVQSGVVSAMMLSCGRIPAAFRSSAGSAIKPRPETEMVACI